MTNFKLNESIDILSRTPTILRSMLADLPDDWIDQNEGEGTWSAFDVIGHLIHGEKTNWIIRAQIIITHGEKKVFETFDRSAFLHENQQKSLESLLDEFEVVRLQNVQYLQTLVQTEKDLDRTGIHPDFGVVTLRELLSTWTVHDFNHIRQIVRVMAKYYEDDVGPWKAYLGIFQTK